MLSKMRRPMRTAATMEEKSSSSRTSPADSRATSVPRPPMAMPMWAAFRAGASLTPSPVIATISAARLQGVDDPQLLGRHDAGKDVHLGDPPGQVGVVHRSSSGPVIACSAPRRPICRATLRAVPG